MSRYGKAIFFLAIVIILFNSLMFVVAQDSNATETSSDQPTVNPPNISDPTIPANREFDPEIGGYIRVEGNTTFVYREALHGDAEVVSRVSSQAFGLITMENPIQLDGNFVTERIAFNERGEEYIEGAIVEVFIQSYMGQFETDRETAEYMFAANEPLGLTWMSSARDWETRGFEFSNPQTRTIIPSSGVSIVLFQEPYHRSTSIDNNYPIMVESFVTTNEQGEYIPAYSYGFEVSLNGRLIIIGYRGGDQGIDQTSTIGFLLMDTIRVISANASMNRFPIEADFHTDYRKTTENQYLIFELLGIPPKDELDNVTDYEAFSVVSVNQE
jgi:hypothetical protein